MTSRPRPSAAARILLLAGAPLAASALPSALAAQAAVPVALTAAVPLYTAPQAEAGKATFERICAKCHQADLSGKDDAPPLGGAYFASSWGGHKASELFDFVKGNMPFDAPGTLDEQTYLGVVAYVLSRNGVPAGDTPLVKDAAGPITVAKD